MEIQGREKSGSELEDKVVTVPVTKIMNALAWLYLLFMTLVLPFYHRQGFAMIGDRKYRLFFVVSIVVIPVLLLLYFLKCIFARKSAIENAEKNTAEHIAVDAGKNEEDRITEYVGKNTAERVTENTGKKEADHVIEYVGENTAECVKGNTGKNAAKNMAENRWMKPCRMVDLCMILYGSTVIVSALFSVDRAVALWGYTDWHMGAVSQLLFVGIYFAISRTWQWDVRIFYILIAASGLICFLGVCNRFAIDPLRMYQGLEYWNKTHLLATIGNINWYCGFLCVTFPIGVALFLCKPHNHENKWQRAGVILWNILLCAAMMTQGSESGLAALAVVLVLYFGYTIGDDGGMLRFMQWNVLCGMTVVALGIAYRLADQEQIYFPADLQIGALLTSPLWIGYLLLMGVLWMLTDKKIKRKSQNCQSEIRNSNIEYESNEDRNVIDKSIRNKNIGDRKKRYAVIIAAISLLLFSAAVIHSLHPSFLPILDKFSILNWNDAWGSGRGHLWKVVWNAFCQMPLGRKWIGVGPDCFALYLYQFHGAELQGFLAEWWGSAMVANAHNEWLNTLINEGIIGCVSYVGIFVTAIMTFSRKRSEKDWTMPALVGCIAAYCVNNTVSFQQVMSTPYLFMLLGIGMSYKKGKGMSHEKNCENSFSAL